MSKLAVLMYHNVHAEISSGLTISVDRLEEQFSYLSEQGYRSWFFSELNGLNELPSGKHIVITFDDAYVSQMEHAVPLLAKYGLKATIFVPFNFVGDTDRWNTSAEAVMSAEQLRSLDNAVIELGQHSFSHINYRDVPLQDVKQDLERSRAFIEEQNLDVSPILAYPYGKFPREEAAKGKFFEQLDEKGFTFACRIGNRLNSFPFSSSYEIQRLDIKGEYSLDKFKRKIKFGKLF